jgi:hypothetical protein
MAGIVHYVYVNRFGNERSFNKSRLHDLATPASPAHRECSR